MMSILSPGLNQAQYFYDDRHFVLSDAQGTAFGPNIGVDGRNLTIMVLSLNRSKQTIRLIDSIVANLINFNGDLLIGDNGSDASELDSLRSRLEQYPYRWRLIEMKKNFGVAGGRNRLMAEARTEWIMSLDNDIYFLSNPLHAVQNEIATLGCHFISFPLLNPDGATLYSHGACLQTVIQGGRPRLTINPIVVPGSRVSEAATEAPVDRAFLCTFLFGGASILNRQSFHRVGGLDEEMLIGFEDIDFSLRLFREGMKVGTSAQRFLVHDHPKAETNADLSYERMRYSRQILYESALRLEQKSGFRVWGDDIENWMRQSEEKQGWAAQGESPGEGPFPVAASAQRKRPRIALITDTDDWAFANIARQLKRHLGDRFDFEIIPLVTLGEIEKSRWFATNCAGFFADGGASALGMALVATEGFDVVHVFWREFFTIIDTPLLEDYARRLGMQYADFRRRFIEGRTFSTSVYDHLFLDPKDVAHREWIFTRLVDQYYVSSERLRKIYEGIPSLPDPSAVLADGVDFSLFQPRALDRFDNIVGREIRVGWVGNSDWASTLEDFKGVNSILKPALKDLQDEGLPLVIDFADRKVKFIPHEQMVEYYARIDVLVCTSKIEGTPNPILEAMACGVPVITTDVGVVPELLGDKQRAFILQDRNIESLKDALRRLVSHPHQFRELSRENLESIGAWEWSRKAEAFAGYFEGLIARRQVATGEARTKMCMLPFSSPSMEPDGSIRLCSASSIFAFYEQTNMGNCRDDGLRSVWEGNRYREVRRGLLTGQDLKPYCSNCEYRFDAPAWMMQLHLGLHAYHNGVRNDEILRLIGKRIARHDEYRSLAPSVHVNAYPIDDALVADVRRAMTEEAEVASKGQDGLTPEALIACTELPVYMDFNTLNRCNVFCTMCPPAIRYEKLGVQRDPYYRLTLPEYRKITDGSRIKSAHFVGAYAEPLLNKDIFALVASAKAGGAFTAITTNGMALSRQFAERLIDAGLDMMTVSLHGATAEVAEAIMLRSNFDKIVENIRVLQSVKRERGTNAPEIYFNYVTQKSNAHEMARFVTLAHDLQVRFVNFIHLIDGDEAVDGADNLIHYPDLLVPNVTMAQARAAECGVILYVSPAYRKIVDDYAGEVRTSAAERSLEMAS